MERSKPLGIRSAQSMASGHLSFCEEDCQNSKINLDDVWSLGKNSQSGDGVLCPESCHREASSFKFSISRLPKWAQAKVTTSNIVCKNLNYTSSEVSVLWIISFPFTRNSILL